MTGSLHLEEALGEVPLERRAQQGVARALEQVQHVGITARHTAVLLHCMHIPFIFPCSPTEQLHKQRHVLKCLRAMHKHCQQSLHGSFAQGQMAKLQVAFCRNNPDMRIRLPVGSGHRHRRENDRHQGKWLHSLAEEEVRTGSTTKPLSQTFSLMTSIPSALRPPLHRSSNASRSSTSSTLITGPAH